MIGKIAVVGASIATMALITVVPTEIVATANADVNSFIYELETSPYADFYGTKGSFIYDGYQACANWQSGDGYFTVINKMYLFNNFDWGAAKVVVDAALDHLC